MQSVRLAKEVKKSSTSPMKTPDKKKILPKAPIAKKSPIKTKLTTIPRKVSHVKSLSQMAILEGLKQTSVNLVEGCEKLRRIIAFSTYRPCFEVFKSIYYTELHKIEDFLALKTMLKAWEILKNNMQNSRRKFENLIILDDYNENYQMEISELLDEYYDLICPDQDQGRVYYSKRLMEKGINGIMSYYCQTMEISQCVQDFYRRKLLRKAFEGLYMTSGYDGVIEAFVKVKMLPKVLRAWKSVIKLQLN
ncbi:hypothetical protein SteCoe_24089 [Stentor coeruleus]|uniref:Uncharacterized protein n=1 Tax=Stentor coeruleus TaxID=5963 RepID=A0A1R2BIA6_9CILI|nr:hypothetical protein SteCoe_24089 [Stentor coeruleus]